MKSELTDWWLSWKLDVYWKAFYRLLCENDSTGQSTLPHWVSSAGNIYLQRSAGQYRLLFAIQSFDYVLRVPDPVHFFELRVAGRRSATHLACRPHLCSTLRCNHMKLCTEKVCGKGTLLECIGARERCIRICSFSRFSFYTCSPCSVLSGKYFFRILLGLPPSNPQQSTGGAAEHNLFFLKCHQWFGRLVPLRLCCRWQLFDLIFWLSYIVIVA